MSNEGEIKAWQDKIRGDEQIAGLFVGEYGAAFLRYAYDVLRLAQAEGRMEWAYNNLIAEAKAWQE